MSDPYEVVDLGKDSSNRTIYMNRRMEAAFDAAAASLGASPTIVQGAYMVFNGGGATDSAGYHDEGGCIDLRVWDLAEKGLTLEQVIRIFRSIGWAAWHRDMAHGGMDEHIHMVLLDDEKAATGAAFQMTDYRAGGNGLSGDSHGVDYHWRPDPIPTFDYDQEIDMLLTDHLPGTKLTVGEALAMVPVLVRKAEHDKRRDQRLAESLPEVVATAVEASMPTDGTHLTRSQIRDAAKAGAAKAVRDLFGSLDEGDADAGSPSGRTT